MNFDPTWLFLSLIPSGIGFVLFVYGRKQERWPQMAGGVALMVYPYFATTVATLLLVGALIVALTWYAISAGW
ncbi:MAG: hypothetical protein ACM3SQ_11360 [Betaproteobacteria bacterium]